MPQRPGNHGRVIPRDPDLLRALYWEQAKTLPEIGVMFDVTHKSVERVFRQLGIPRRRVGTAPARGCIECGAAVFKIKHATNGALYGRRCKEHWNKHRALLQKEDCKRPEVRERRRREMRRWYYDGPLNPREERGWIAKGRANLRATKRLLAGKESPVV